jgi:hypothetical protein
MVTTIDDALSEPTMKLRPEFVYREEAERRKRRKESGGALKA